MNQLLTPKQVDFMLEPLHRINLLDGSVRSGKTYVSLARWAMWVRQRPKDELFMMVGKTRESLQFNCLDLLEELTGGAFTANRKSNIGWLYGHEVRLLGANDEKAASKIKGSTLAGAYIDELTEIPESFYKMTLSRLSVDGAILLATTNPESPASYVYTDIVCNDDIDRRCWHFLLEDNTFLGRAFIDNIKREYTGVFFRRYILGEWAIAEGLVYANYDNTVKPSDLRYTAFSVSMDYGTRNPTAMLLWAQYGGVWYCIAEYYHSGRETEQGKTDEEYYTELERLVDNNGATCGAYDKLELIIDPSAASFIETVHRHKRFKVRKAHNEVLDGIRNTMTALEQRKILFYDTCIHTLDEFQLYSWDDKSQQDAIIKENDHCLSGETLVQTLLGKRRIKDLVGKRGWVWSYDERRKRKCLRRFHDVRQTGKNREMMRITTEDGKQVCCTPDHLILTAAGWKQAQEITERDSIIEISHGIWYN